MYTNSIVEFYKTLNRYKVLSGEAEMKHPDTGDWIPAVIYEEYQHLEGGKYSEVIDKKIYVREKKDFLRKFNLSMGL